MVVVCFGHDTDEIARIRPRLEVFANQMLGGLSRRDQRATGELYLRGLMLDGQRKSVQPMAERLGVDHQRLQQLITSLDLGRRRRPSAAGRLAAARDRS